MWKFLDAIFIIVAVSFMGSASYFYGYSDGKRMASSSCSCKKSCSCENCECVVTK